MSTTKKIKIIAVDNHEMILKGYELVLGEAKNYELIGKAFNGKELIDLLVFKEPDIIILDLEMPVMNGDEALKIVKAKYPEIKVLISSMHYGVVLVTHYAKLGADGYLPKDCAEKLIEALDHLSSGKYYFDTMISREIISDYAQHQKLQFLSQVSLSKTEERVLKLICESKKNKEIAKILNISIHTVDAKRRSIYEKIKVSELPDLIKYAIKNGMISLD